MIRSCTISDAQEITDIYNYYVENTAITFDEYPLPTEEIALRIENTMRCYPWFVYENKDKVLGFAYASRFREKSAYRYTVESTIYVKHGEENQGIGTLLYQRLISESKQKSIHCMVGVISLPNPASIRLHEKMGFKKVAHMKQIGRKFNQWIDVGYWELVLE